MNSVSTKVGCINEYDTLRTVILCEPKFMNISNKINETQKYFSDIGVNIGIAKQQFNRFIHILEEFGIDVLLLTANNQFPEQVFTRDIGFTIGSKLFISKMSHPVRQGEEEALKAMLSEKNISFNEPFNHSIEGGDIIIDQDIIYVGISGRTEYSSAQALQQECSGYKMQPIPIANQFLHLDCVFNIISTDEALIYSSALSNESREILCSKYNLIEVDDTEQFCMGTNVLPIGNKTILSLATNFRLNNELIMRGYNVVEIEFEEIIKSGGSLRCCTLPIFRGN